MNNIEKQLKKLITAFDDKEKVIIYKEVSKIDKLTVDGVTGDKIIFKNLDVPYQVAGLDNKGSYWENARLEYTHLEYNFANIEVDLLADPFCNTARSSGRTTQLVNILIKKISESMSRGEEFSALVITRNVQNAQFISQKLKDEFINCKTISKDKIAPEKIPNVTFTTVSKVIEDRRGYIFDLILSDVGKNEIPNYNQLAQIYTYLRSCYKEDGYNMQAKMIKDNILKNIAS